MLLASQAPHHQQQQHPASHSREHLQPPPHLPLARSRLVTACLTLPHLQIPSFRADPLQKECDTWCEFPVKDRANAVMQWIMAVEKEPSMLKGAWLLMLESDYVWVKPLMVSSPHRAAVQLHWVAALRLAHGSAQPGLMAAAGARHQAPAAADPACAPDALKLV